MKKLITIDFFLKLCLICSISYFTFCATEYLNKTSEIGRYQFLNYGYQLYVIDTKTGSVFNEGILEFKIIDNRK